MTTSIENTLKELYGLELTQTTRSSNMECLKFGFKINNKNQNIGEFGLHIQADWRIVNEKNILVGSKDLYQPNAENESEVDFDYENGNLRDEKLKKFIDSNNSVVSNVFMDKFGGLNIRFNNKTELQIIPTNSSESEYNEYWRLIDNRKSESEHLVVGIHGIENQ